MATEADGERVIGGTRRPDGTTRKERKVRPGYVPQDEQQVYVSRGAQFRDSAKNHVPGMDSAALAAARAANAAANKSKVAKKNEKRKEKKAVEKTAGGSSMVSAAGSMTSVGDCMQQLSLGGGGDSRAADGSACAAVPPTATGGSAPDPAAAEKQIRALKKKLRQCQILQREQEEGSELTEQEQLKLDKVQEWKKELAALEQ